MSTACFIVLDREDTDFDSFVDGKVLTGELEAVNEIASGLGLKRFEDYASQDLSEFDVPEMETLWFDAAEGVAWASKILNHVRENPGAVKEADAVGDDLADYVRVFEEAQKRGLKWHFELDF